MEVVYVEDESVFQRIIWNMDLFILQSLIKNEEKKNIW